MKSNKQFKQEAKKERGFSLGEFLLLVSVFGVLTSIALPAYVSYRIQKINSSAKADVLSLGQSVLETADAEELADCSGAACEEKYHGFEKSAGSKISTTATSGDMDSPVIIGCGEGGSKGYMFTASTGMTIEFPLSNGNCAPGGIEG